jgi:hypothetical protein
VCEFFSTYTPPTPGYPRWCRYASTPAAFCGHPQAKLLAFRKAVRLELEALEVQKREGFRTELQLREDRIKNDECPDCGVKLIFRDLGSFTGFDGEARGLRRESVVCQRCKSYTTRIVSKDGERCPWSELTAMAKKEHAE